LGGRSRSYGTLKVDMYAYYKRSLLKMRNLLRQVQTDPVGRRDECRLLQEQMLATVMRIEKQIRKHRRELKKVRNYLSKPHENPVDNASSSCLVFITYFEIRHSIDQIAQNLLRMVKKQINTAKLNSKTRISYLEYLFVLNIHLVAKRSVKE